MKIIVATTLIIVILILLKLKVIAKMFKIISVVILVFIIFLIIQPKICPTDTLRINKDECILLYKRASQGDHKALGRLYMHYAFVAKDYKTSSKIIRYGALLGYSDFQNNYVHYLENGKIKEHCKNEKIYWLLKASKNGDKTAIYDLNNLKIDYKNIDLSNCEKIYSKKNIKKFQQDLNIKKCENI